MIYFKNDEKKYLTHFYINSLNVQNSEYMEVKTYVQSIYIRYMVSDIHLLSLSEPRTLAEWGFVVSLRIFVVIDDKPYLQKSNLWKRTVLLCGASYRYMYNITHVFNCFSQSLNRFRGNSFTPASSRVSCVTYCQGFSK